MRLRKMQEMRVQHTDDVLGCVIALVLSLLHGKM